MLGLHETIVSIHTFQFCDPVRFDSSWGDVGGVRNSDACTPEMKVNMFYTSMLLSFIQNVFLFLYK